MSNPYVCWSNQKFLAVNASQRIHSQQPGVTFLLYQVLPRHTPDVALRSACKPRGNLVFDIFGPGAATRVAELEGQMVKNHD